MSETNTSWAVVNKESGKVAWTRESEYRQPALFETRQAARRALWDGRVYVDPTKGRVSKV